MVDNPAVPILYLVELFLFLLLYFCLAGVLGTDGGKIPTQSIAIGVLESVRRHPVRSEHDGSFPGSLLWVWTVPRSYDQYGENLWAHRIFPLMPRGPPSSCCNHKSCDLSIGFFSSSGFGNPRKEDRRNRGLKKRGGVLRI